LQPVSAPKQPRSVVKLHFNHKQTKNALTRFLFCKQTYYLFIIWAFTWFSFWMVAKNQITIFNLIGEASTICAFVLLRFSTTQDSLSKTLKLVTPQLQRNVHHMHSSTSSFPFKRIQAPTAAFTRVKFPTFRSAEKTPTQITSIKTQKQEMSPIPKSNEPVQLSPPKLSGCPKNLAYFSMKPRPEETPEECFSCKKLVSCVCLTSN